MNVWIPLIACGVSSPSLQLVNQRIDYVLQPSPHGRSIYGEIGAEIAEADVLQEYGAALVAPNMRAGDAIVFSGKTIHRSHIVDGMTEHRDSLDLRFVRA